MRIGQKVKRRDGKIVEITDFSKSIFSANDGHLRWSNGQLYNWGTSDEDIIDFNPSEPQKEMQYCGECGKYMPDGRCVYPHEDNKDRTTLTRREQFAMAAMQGLLITDGTLRVVKNELAEQSIKIADALIAALDEEKK